MSAEVENFLAHFGVKGMQWGVRNNVEIAGRVSLTNPTLGGNVVVVRTTSTKANPANAAESQQAAEATMNTMHVMLTSKRGAMQSAMTKVDAKYDPMDLAQKAETRRAYDHEMSQTLTKEAQKIAPKGSKAFVRVDGDDIDLYVGSPAWHAKVYDGPVHHDALSDDVGVHSQLRVNRDANGFITSFTLKDNLAHSALERFIISQADTTLSSITTKEVKDGSG